MLTGRKEELEELNRLYAADQFQFTAVYGRRRIGKTALVNEFSMHRDAIYFAGFAGNDKQHLDGLSRSISYYMTGSASELTFSSFEEALAAVFQIAEEEQLVFIIDDYLLFEKAYKSLATTLQTLIKEKKETSRLFLLITLPSMDSLSKGPLKSRITAKLELAPLNFFASKTFFRNISMLEAAALYSVTGGIPYYLEKFDQTLSFKDNVMSKVLTSAAELFEEPQAMLAKEVREPAAYHSVLSVIAKGSEKLSEIAAALDEETSACAAYLRKLISLGIVKKASPLGEDSPRKTRYAIADNLFRFHHTFLLPNLSFVQSGRSDLAYQEIEASFSSYMEPVFEEICRHYLWRLNKTGKTPFTFTALGRYWNVNPKIEIDIMGTDGSRSALFCECRWADLPLDADALSDLFERSATFSYKNKVFYLFSRRGFTLECQEMAAKYDNVILVAF